MSSTGDLAVVAASPDDSRILSLFREWMAAHRAAQAIWDQVDYGEEETRTANVRCFDIIRAIADIPAAGPAGLAIKAYLRHHNEYAEFIVDPPCAIPSFEEGDERYYDAHLDKSIIEDAVCFAPELAPLINGVRRGTPSAAVEGSSMTEEERCIAERGLALLPAYRALSHGADWAVCPPEPPAPGKRELTDAEREFADTFIELGYRPSTVAGDPKPKVIGFGEPSEPS